MPVRGFSVEKVIGDLKVRMGRVKRVDSAGDRLAAFIQWVADAGARPDQGLPGSQPGVDNSLPGGQGGTPDQGLPGSQPGVDNTLPSGRPGGRPDQSLPGAQPGVDNSLPGQGGRPDQSLPGAGGAPDQGLPGSQPGVDNSLPSFLADHVDEIVKAILEGTPCDPAAQPKR